MVCEVGCLQHELPEASLECSAFNLLIQHLGRNGNEASFKCAAENTACSWTVDGVVESDGEIWIIDHMRLTWPQRTKPWMKEAEAAFRQDLEEIAHESGIRIVVLIPDLRGHGDKRTRQIADAELKEELRLALSYHAWALEAPTEFIELPLGLSYQLLPAESTDENSVSPVGVGFSMAQGRTIREQFTEFNLPTILTKLSSQLAPALGDFAHAGLILDQRYVEREEPPLTNPILTPATMKSVLDSERAVKHSNLDKVWLIGECDYIEEIWARSD